MFNILVVDDEPLVRLAVRSLENWEASGLHIKGEASNGEEALEFLESDHSVDIALIDVDMPSMNGLELAEEIKKRNLALSCVFLSSFDTFEYARRAFKAGAADYVLKTEMDEGRLLSVLGKVSSRLGKERVEDKKGLHETKEGYLQSILSGQLPLKKVSFRFQFPVSLVLFGPTDEKILNERYSDNPGAFLKITLDLLRQCVFRLDTGEVFAVAMNRYIALVDATENFKGFIDDFTRNAQNYLDISFDHSVIKSIEDWSLVRDSYLNAEQLFSASSRMIVQSRRYIRDHYTEQYLNLAAIADYVGVSKNHLSWEFSKETGGSISDYIAKVRVEAAKVLLDTTKDKTYEISEKVGFKNVETFNRVFKKITGKTPREY
jgi:two-component system response regulator YesN